MHIQELNPRLSLFVSDELPSIQTYAVNLGEVIAWADAHPSAWHIVCSRRSKAFGRESPLYEGWAQGSHAPVAILERARLLFELAHSREAPEQILGWAARQTLSLFRDREFEGALFAELDGTTIRRSLPLDFTPATAQKTLERFRQWLGPSAKSIQVLRDGARAREVAIVKGLDVAASAALGEGQDASPLVRRQRFIRRR